MPRSPGSLYNDIASSVAAAAWRAALRGAKGIHVVKTPSTKEVHVIVGKAVFSVKIVERRWYTSPKLLLQYARSLLRHGKEYARSVHPVLLVPRLTRGAVRLAYRLRWLRIVPYRVGALAAYWVLEKLLELVNQALQWRLEKGLQPGPLPVLARELAREQKEVSSRRGTHPE